MATWMTKLFGDNRLNFYGWIIAGLIVAGVSMLLVVAAILTGAFRSPEGMLLVAIYFVLLGLFSIALQNYCARAAGAIERRDAEKAGTSPPPPAA